MRKIIFIISILTLFGCSLTNPIDKSRKSYYKYEDHSKTTSLVVPPNLTQPKFVNDITNPVIDEGIFITPKHIQIKSSGSYRYLLVDHNINSLWYLVQNFLEDTGLVIERSEENIGVIETNYLRRRFNIPEEELGIVRNYFRKLLDSSYAQTVLDKYIIRLETHSYEQTEIYLTIKSLEEFNISSIGAKSETISWRLKPRDINQEIVMLYRLMAYLGKEEVELPSSAIITDPKDEKIQSILAKDNKKFKLKIALNKEDTWRHIGWALDRLSVRVADKDQQEGSFYVQLNSTTNKNNILSKLFKTTGKEVSLQLLVQQLDYDHSQVLLNVLSLESRDYSNFNRIFLEKLAKELNQ